MQRDPFQTPDPWKTRDPWTGRDPFKAPDPFGVNLDKERQRARQERQERRSLEAAQKRQAKAQRSQQAAPRDAERTRTEAPAQTNDQAIEAARQVEARRRYLDRPTLDGRHEREQIQDKAERAEQIAKDIRAKFARDKERSQERDR